MELNLVNGFHPRPPAYRPERAATANSGETLYAMADLKLLISNADDLAVNQLCTIAHLDKTGSLDSRKERLSSFLVGLTRRQRSGWLQFFLHVVDSDAVGPRKTKRRSRHRQPVVDRRQRVQINSRNISETKQSVGPVHDRRFRVSSQQADSSLLVPPRGSRNSGQGRIPSGLEAPENLGLPPVSADSTSAKSGSRPENNSSNNSTLLDQSVLVPPSAGNVPGLENPGPSSIGVPSSSTPGEILSVSAEDQARLFMEYGSVQNMRQHLQQQGFGSAYIDRILRRWEDPEVKTTISQHKHMWDTLFVPWCVKQRHNPFEYDVHTQIV